MACGGHGDCRNKHMRRILLLPYSFLQQAASLHLFSFVRPNGMYGVRHNCAWEAMIWSQKVLLTFLKLCSKTQPSSRICKRECQRALCLSKTVLKKSWNLWILGVFIPHDWGENKRQPQYVHEVVPAPQVPIEELVKQTYTHKPPYPFWLKGSSN